ncbi:bifunctional oligoribonuclease/PAP phosphatase NrnA [Haladaptatus pallidirubidus]|uniref:Bifunctional oligoribonuclease/PAP phosphatase NrnA n=1 Tax=Haladaptatus pallidirubidus TaxID=1008152 RepID=A0AAV3UBF3_9EURY|nr:bifunctional oligoribonuclease/PAP phosphatase NrnA [Haladaptatus pallidirubidus]
MPAGFLAENLAVVLTALLFVLSGGGVLYAVQFRTLRRGTEKASIDSLRETVAGQNRVALVVPEGASIDSLASAVGLQALCKDWGVAGRIAAEGEVTGEDSKAFCNIFDVDLTTIDGRGDQLQDCDAAIAVGGGGAVPRLSNNPPVICVIRHRPTAEENILTITRTDDGATSTVVTKLIRDAKLIPDQRVATALLYGIRAGTREFRRANGKNDYDAAGFLHAFADLGRIEDLRSPGVSGDTFDVLGEAIANRERRASFAVTNVGVVPSVSALEEAADSLLRLEGVSTAAVFGIHEETIVISCRAEDVRTSAVDILDGAFDASETTGGNTDAATARVPLGIFAQVDGEHATTLDSLIDASTRKALFAAFESS